MDITGADVIRATLTVKNDLGLQQWWGQPFFNVTLWHMRRWVCAIQELSTVENDLGYKRWLVGGVQTFFTVTAWPAMQWRGQTELRLIWVGGSDHSWTVTKTNPGQSVA